MDMDNLLQREILPFLKAAGLDWRGWHAFRRGLATNLSDLEVPDEIIQRITRHDDIATLRRCYIRTRDKRAVAAMAQLQAAVDTAGQLSSAWPVPMTVQSENKGLNGI